MDPRITETITRVTGRKPIEFRPLSGGCIGDVYRVTLEGSGSLVAKVGDGSSGLDIEGYMLEILGPHLPVPDVLHAEPGLLLMSYLLNDGGLTADSQAHAAELLASLHDVPGKAFGLDQDTLIGGLHQPNPWTERWIDFFRDQRLLFMARDAQQAGRLPGRLMDRIEKMAARLDRWISEPTQSSLLHGDMWTGNVLCRGRRIAGFVDPACYYGDPEIELAFSTLFGTFGKAFFQRYEKLRPIAPGFFEERRDLYNLYPLLVHVRLFGGSYVGSVDRTLSRFGF
ncbi:fructosamine kinase family protein [Magnetospira sp. QH-2]|uniref:fructosamine kinase family protein n=1 Tax=Magnetospira sp. (strain QH-2) TaxID=1288970 RepID=UPI0005F9DD0F|nr:fructosamine kinase family protein [Magnetospira sp. QH-2]